MPPEEGAETTKNPAESGATGRGSWIIDWSARTTCDGDGGSSQPYRPAASHNGQLVVLFKVNVLVYIQFDST